MFNDPCACVHRHYVHIVCGVRYVAQRGGPSCPPHVAKDPWAVATSMFFGKATERQVVEREHANRERQAAEKSERDKHEARLTYAQVCMRVTWQTCTLFALFSVLAPHLSGATLPS